MSYQPFSTLNQEAPLSTKKDTGSKLMSYFSQLSKEQILKLSEMYALDFKLFDYDIDSYHKGNEYL